MPLQIPTTQISPAPISVPYTDSFSADGAVQPTGTYTWKLGKQPPFNESDLPLDDYLIATKLPAGLTWSYADNVVTITGTPTPEGFPDISSEPGDDLENTLYPERVVSLEFEVIYEGPDYTERAERIITMKVTRIVDENSATWFLDSFSVQGDYIKEELIVQAVDGIRANFSDNVPVQEAVVNDLVKKLEYHMMMQVEDGSFQTFYSIKRDEGF